MRIKIKLIRAWVYTCLLHLIEKLFLQSLRKRFALISDTSSCIYSVEKSEWENFEMVQNIKIIWKEKSFWNFLREKSLYVCACALTICILTVFFLYYGNVRSILIDFKLYCQFIKVCGCFVTFLTHINNTV